LVCLVNSEKAKGRCHSREEEEGKGKWMRGNSRRGRTPRDSEAGKELSKGNCRASMSTDGEITKEGDGTPGR